MATSSQSPAGGAALQGSQQWVSVVVHDRYAVLSMCKEPVNSMDLAMWTQLEKALDELEADKNVQGLIITSGLKRDVFTAGNDLMELYAPRTSRERYRNFWVVSNRVLLKLYKSRLATIAAIRGACPAGGCMMSMCCDHRIITPNGTMGLNEVQLGIPVPRYWGLLMQRIIGAKAADKLLLTGKMVNAQEAKALGLVDQVVEKEGLLPAAEKVMASLVKLPGHAVASTKAGLRQSFCAEWEPFFTGEEPEGGWATLVLPETRKTLEGVLARLSSAGKGGKGEGGQQPSKL